MKKNNALFKYIGAGVALLILLGLVGGGLFAAGYKIGTERPKNIIVKGITNIDDPDVTADFSVFWAAWDELKKSHINGKEAKDQDLVFGAVSGMVGALKDPNTVFLPPADSEKFQEDIQGSFGGIGAEIGIRFDQLIVVSPLESSPAEKAGLRAGDKILEVDGTSTAGVGVNDAVKLIRGPIGTKVVLTIFRDTFSEPKKISIVRDTIRIPTSDITMLEAKNGEKIAHIKLYSFNADAPTSFYNRVATAFQNDAKGVILDLRNNPGGFLEVAVDIAGWFLKKGAVVAKEEFRQEYSDRNQVFAAHGNEALVDIPVVVLMNGGSASASEILAGALRDNRKVKLVGEKSFGKGTVQELKELTNDEATLKVTVARWVLPSGETIEKNGLKPDVEVKPTEKDIEEGKDPQLDKAIEVLKTDMANRPPARS